MAKDEQRGVRDQAGIGPDPINAERLVAIGTVEDFKIAEGEPDVRGWEVYSSAGAFIGDVSDLLVDPELRQVVMLEIDRKDTAHRGRAPIKAGWLDHDRKRVILDSAQLDPALLEHRSHKAAEVEEVVVRRPVDTGTLDREETVEPRARTDAELHELEQRRLDERL
ncbi:MAG TPA: PRC-barrel domain-containing protein [Gemmatimonadaceae bacterium]|nr:PRC-barrel domain-containing protein [Gemmatimonadaceae bacterium]